MASGSLPAALSLAASSGVISGAASSGAGSHDVTVTAKDSHSVSADSVLSFSLSKGTPTITWATPAAITYGTELSTTQLDATASVAGTFAYTPLAATTPKAGTDTLSVTFTPTDTTDYTTATKTVSLTVNKATPVITWAAPATIAHGTALSATQLDATASVPGTFVYTPAAGTTPVAGTDTLSVIFTPTDTIDYNVVPAVTSLVVSGTAPLIHTVAGDGTNGSSGDGGAATSATIGAAVGVAFDAAGNLYIADLYNARVRKVTASTGVISTVAGTGTAGFSGDGGSAPSAELNYPAGVAFDKSGNMYIADRGNERIRKVSAVGTITTVAGNGTPGYTGDGGQATSAELNVPFGVSVDSSGNFYIADQSANVVRKVTVATGVITTVAGTGTAGFSGDGGLATAAELSGPPAVALDSANNIYIADQYNNRVRKVTASTGIITTVAGGGPVGYVGDGGPATSAYIAWADGVAVDSAGDIYVSDKNDQRVRKVTAGTITTVAGNGVDGYSGDGGPATSAELSYPPGIALDADGNLYIADEGNYRIRAVSTTVVTPTVTWAPPGAITYGTTLSATQLNATASVPGKFVYTPASGTTLKAGTQTLSVTFTPIDTADYAGVTKTVSLTVNKATPTITWATPTAITYGTPLSSTQLDAVPLFLGSTLSGTTTYSPVAGTLLTPGSYTLGVTFTPADTADFTGPVTSSIPLQVQAGAVTISVTCSPSSISWGATNTCTATLTKSGSAAAPTGTVEFADTGAVIATITLPATTYSYQALSVGTHSMTVAYSGDSNYLQNLSPVFTQVVSLTASSCTVP